jgi:hypothetical protein
MAFTASPSAFFCDGFLMVQSVARRLWAVAKLVADVLFHNGNFRPASIWASISPQLESFMVRDDSAGGTN